MAQVNVKLTEEERVLLKRRAAKMGMGETDYVRVCMMMEAVTAGDLGAMKMVGEGLRRKFAGVFSSRILDAPVKA